MYRLFFLKELRHRHIRHKNGRCNCYYFYRLKEWRIPRHFYALFSFFFLINSLILGGCIAFLVHTKQAHNGLVIQLVSHFYALFFFFIFVHSLIRWRMHRLLSLHQASLQQVGQSVSHFYALFLFLLPRQLIDPWRMHRLLSLHQAS